MTDERVQLVHFSNSATSTEKLMVIRPIFELNFHLEVVTMDNLIVLCESQYRGADLVTKDKGV